MGARGPFVGASLSEIFTGRSGDGTKKRKKRSRIPTLVKTKRKIGASWFLWEIENIMYFHSFGFHFVLSNPPCLAPKKSVSNFFLFVFGSAGLTSIPIRANRHYSIGTIDTPLLQPAAVPVKYPPCSHATLVTFIHQKLGFPSEGRKETTQKLQVLCKCLTCGFRPPLSCLRTAVTPVYTRVKQSYGRTIS